MHYSLHKLELDTEVNYSIEDTNIDFVIPKGAEERFVKAREDLAPLFEQKKFPVGQPSLVIHQTTLLMYGGQFQHLLNYPYLFAIDLKQLVPNISLEQHAALAALKHKSNIGAAKLATVAEDLRIKTNLW